MPRRFPTLAEYKVPCPETDILFLEVPSAGTVPACHTVIECSMDIFGHTLLTRRLGQHSVPHT